MKEMVCIGSKDAGTKNDVEILAQSLQSQGLQTPLKVCYWEDILFSITSDELHIVDMASGVDLVDAQLVIALNWYKTGNMGFYRDMAFTLALYLQQAGVKFWNSEMLQQRSTTKLSALAQLAQGGVSVPKTLFSLDKSSLADKAISTFNFPMIVKTIAGSRGSHNHLVQDLERLRQLFEDDAATPYMIEEYIPNDHDLRVVCYGGEPAMAIKRSRVGSETHLNNTSKGGTAELLSLVDVDKTILNMCSQACVLLGREMAGVDIMLANDGSQRMVCLEVNAIPQLTSGSYTSEKAAHLAMVLNEYLKGIV